MEDGKITGRIENVETGEISYLDHYLLWNEFKLKTIVKIINIQSWTHAENSMQISVDCLGLDSIGFVFELSLDFFPATAHEMNRIIEDLKADDIFIVSGMYTIICEDYETLITISGPEYVPARLHFSEEEIREAFRINSKNLEDIENA